MQLSWDLSCASPAIIKELKLPSPMHKTPGSLLCLWVNVPVFNPCFLGCTQSVPPAQLGNFRRCLKHANSSPFGRALIPVEPVNKHITQESIPHLQLLPWGFLNYVTWNIWLVEKYIPLNLNDLSFQQACTHSQLHTTNSSQNYFTSSFVFEFLEALSVVSLVCLCEKQLHLCWQSFSLRCY